MTINSSAKSLFQRPYYFITPLLSSSFCYDNPLEELEQPLGNVFARSFGLISPPFKVL